MVSEREEEEVPDVSTTGRYPRLERLPDGTEVWTVATMHPSAEEIARMVKPRNVVDGHLPSPWELDPDRIRATDAPEVAEANDNWLDDYEEGSTSEEVLYRVKNGMVLSYLNEDPDEIAAEVVRRAAQREREGISPDVGTTGDA